MVIPFLYADGTEIDEFQHTGRKQVFVVSPNVAESIQCIVGPLQVTVVWNGPIPEQVFFHFLPRPPDINEIEDFLKKAKEKRAFIILGTHSSNIEEFAPEKIKSVLMMAKEMGFKQL